jgi:hypothetical protein
MSDRDRTQLPGMSIRDEIQKLNASLTFAVRPAGAVIFAPKQAQVFLFQ